MNINAEPLVSIVIPCYNHEDFVQECIQSVIDQDYKNIELIIIDDGSPDDSVRKIEEMIPKCKERFVRFEFRHRSNKGLCATLNEALTWCQGLFYSAFASDDVMLPQKTSTQVNLLNQSPNNIIGLFAGISVFNGTSSNKKIATNAIYTFEDIFLHNCKLTTPTLMLKLKEVIQAGGYNENVKIEDLELFLRLTKKGYNLQAIDTVLVLYRRHGSNLSAQNELMSEATKKIIYKYQNHPLFKRALSKNSIVSAHSTLASNDKLSQKYILEAIKIYPLNIFSISFIKYFLKKILILISFK